jgi:hypothetical protein
MWLVLTVCNELNCVGASPTRGWEWTQLPKHDFGFWNTVGSECRKLCYGMLCQFICPDSRILVWRDLVPGGIIFTDRLCGLVVRVPGYRSRGPRFDSQRYQIFWEVVGLERGPLSLVSTIEELPGRNSSGSGLEIREYGRGDLLCWPRENLFPQISADKQRSLGWYSSLAD